MLGGVVIGARVRRTVHLAALLLRAVAVVALRGGGFGDWAGPTRAADGVAIQRLWMFWTGGWGGQGGGGDREEVGKGGRGGREAGKGGGREGGWAGGRPIVGAEERGRDLNGDTSGREG